MFVLTVSFVILVPLVVDVDGELRLADQLDDTAAVTSQKKLHRLAAVDTRGRCCNARRDPPSKSEQLSGLEIDDASAGVRALLARFVVEITLTCARPDHHKPCQERAGWISAARDRHVERSRPRTSHVGEPWRARRRTTSADDRSDLSGFQRGADLR